MMRDSPWSVNWQAVGLTFAVGSGIMVGWFMVALALRGLWRLAFYQGC